MAISLSRRDAICGGAAAPLLFAPQLFAAQSGQPNRPSACLTPQIGKADAYFDEFQPYIIRPGEAEPAEIETFMLRPEDKKNTKNAQELFQLLLRNDRWRPSTASHFKQDTGKLILNISFRDGSPRQKQWVRDICQEWLTGLEHKIGFRFVEGLQEGIIKISFKAVGTEQKANWSKIGNKARGVRRAGSVSMMLESVADGESIDRVRFFILHEFGHALGLRHEHTHPQAGYEWKDREEVKRYFRKLHMTDSQIENDILTTLSMECRCIGAEEFDGKSVMNYPFPPELLKVRRSVTLQSQLSANDLKCIRSTYLE